MRIKIGLRVNNKRSKDIYASFSIEISAYSSTRGKLNDITVKRKL